MTTDLPADGALPDEDEQIERGETGVRVALTLLFFLVANLVEALFALLAVFSLIWTLVTRRRTGPHVRAFALRALAYVVEIGRYLTYLDDDAPFPFRELPREPRLGAPRGSGAPPDPS